MASTYLNANQKHALAKVFACYIFLSEAAEKAYKHMPKDVLTDLRHAKTRAYGAYDKWIRVIDDKSARGVVNVIRDMEIVIQTRKEASKEVKEMSAYISGKEYVERFAEITMDAKCKTCDGTIRDTCPLYEGYVHFQLEPYDPKHPNCPYSQVEVSV